MSIMMEVFLRGKPIGRCDAKCYKSKSKTCHCVCRGHLHGLGRNAAVRKLRTLKDYYRSLAFVDRQYDVRFF